MKLYQSPGSLLDQWLRELRGKGHEDVRLVCGDGTVSCSGLLLASGATPALAEALRGLDRCSLCTGQVVILLPEFK